MLFIVALAREQKNFRDEREKRIKRQEINRQFKRKLREIAAKLTKKGKKKQVRAWLVFIFLRGV